MKKNISNLLLAVIRSDEFPGFGVVQSTVTLLSFRDDPARAPQHNVSQINNYEFISRNKSNIMERKIKVYKRTIVFVVFLTLLLNIDCAIAQYNNAFGLGGGISKATGDGSEFWNIGLEVSGEYYRKVSENVLIGAGIAINHWELNEDKFEGDVSGSNNIIELTPSIMYVQMLSQELELHFLGQIGAGYYINNQDIKDEISSTTFHDSKFGVNFGAGIMIGGSKNAILTVTPKYHIVFTEGESMKYFAVNLGILFIN